MGEDEFTSLLGKFTDDELEEELERRKEPPDPLPPSNDALVILHRLARSYLTSISDNGRPSKDAEHFIFETVMKTLYGPDIFDWINLHSTG